MNLYNTLLITEIGLAVIITVGLAFISAPYGKFYRKGWGPHLPAKWGWLIMESPAVFVMGYFFFKSDFGISSIVFLLIWQLHYLHRMLVYPFQTGSNKPFPVLLVVFAISFNLMNGYVNGNFLFIQSSFSAEWLVDPRFMFGFVVFIVGFVINKNSDRILQKLRKRSAEYQIPTGGLFRYASNPHYFGEILEWTGWAILTWSLPGLAFALFTVANLAPRALAAHRWYMLNFSNYPPSRRVLIPFVW